MRFVTVVLLLLFTVFVRNPQFPRLKRATHENNEQNREIQTGAELLVGEVVNFFAKVFEAV